MSDPYRDSRAAERERLDVLDRRVAELEATLLPIFWERVAPAWGVRSHPAQSDPVAARQARIEQLEELIARARGGLRAARDLPHASRGDVALPNVDEPDVARGLEVVHDFDPAARYEVSREQWRVVFRAEEVPIELRAERHRSGESVWWTWRGITTVVPTARLSLGPEGFAQDMLELVGLRREIELGDPAFDPVFLVEGEASSARALLTDELRRMLLDLATGTAYAPRVQIDSGLASIALTGTAGRSGIRRLIRALVHLHRAPSPVAVLADARTL